jgi:hypothetical protein
MHADAFFEMCARFCSHPEMFCAFANRIFIEIGGFDYNHFRILINIGISAAHNAGDCHMFFPVINHQHAVIQTAFHAIKRGHNFTLLRVLHNDLSACELIIIKCVQRLSRFQHYKIRDIHDIADRTDTCAHQRTCIHIETVPPEQFSPYVPYNVCTVIILYFHR